MKGMLTYIPLLLTALSIFFGATQYARTQQQEFRKRYWEAQFTLYTDAAASASAIANARNLGEVDTERKRFWQLYWGPLSTIEHPVVESAMVRYGAVLAECEKGTTASCPSGLPGATHTPLRDASINLAHCIRVSLATTWHPVDIGDLSGRCEGQENATPPPRSWWRSWLGP